MQRVDVNRLLNLLFDLSNIDIHKLEVTPREKMVRELMGQIEQRANQGQPSEGAQREMGDVAARLGIARA